jgi:cell shape-determining protein MreC
MHSLQQENDELKHAKLTTAPDLQRLAQLEAENDRLRKLLAVTEREKANGQVSQILYTARDPSRARSSSTRASSRASPPGNRPSTKPAWSARSPASSRSRPKSP